MDVKWILYFYWTTLSGNISGSRNYEENTSELVNLEETSSFLNTLIWVETRLSDINN